MISWTLYRAHTQMPVTFAQHRNFASEMYLNHSNRIPHNIVTCYFIARRECPFSFMYKSEAPFRQHKEIPYFHYRNLSFDSTQDTKLLKPINIEPIAIFRPDSICIVQRPPQSPLRSQRLPPMALLLKCPLQSPPTMVTSPASALTARYANAQNAPAART